MVIFVNPAGSMLILHLIQYFADDDSAYNVMFDCCGMSCLAAAFGCTRFRNAVIAHRLDTVECQIKFVQASDVFHNSD